MPDMQASISFLPSSVAGTRRTDDDLPVTSSRTIAVVDSTLGPVSATGANFNPLRRQASAAAVAIGPGMPLTIIINEDEFSSTAPSPPSVIVDVIIRDDDGPMLRPLRGETNP
jgi:hypothetical protein